MNQVVLFGRVGGDPEVRYLESGSVVADVSLATSQKYKTKDGETKEDTQWHKLVFWGNTAKVVEQYVTKGDQILVQGSVKYDQWTTESGEKREKAKIQVLKLELLGGSARNRTEKNAEPGTQLPTSPSQSVVNGISEDDLPF
jgi:single-strand DNA-binding protein